MSDMTLSHAKKLRYLRKLSDKKQTDVAEVLGMTQQAYSKLENAETAFSDEVIEKIAAFFNITPQDFERPLDSIIIGSNNQYTGSNIHIADQKLMNTLQDMYEHNRSLYDQLLKEKDLRIELLEKLMSKKD